MTSLWGSGKICVYRHDRWGLSLVFSTGFSSFRGRPLEKLERIRIRCMPFFIDHPPMTSLLGEGSYSRFHNYNGLDLIKWEGTQDFVFGGRITNRPVIKTRCIRLLQQRTRKLIKKKRREHFKKYLLRMFHKGELCPDVLTSIADFVIGA